MKQQKVNKLFRKFSSTISRLSGSPIAFLLALSIVVVWFCSGFYFNWSTEHSLLINTTTTVVNFLMCFIIQSSQNRNDLATQIKLNELILATKEARNIAINLEEREEAEAEELKKEFKQIREHE